jgi:hypothetical protein
VKGHPQGMPLHLIPNSANSIILKILILIQTMVLKILRS